MSSICVVVTIHDQELLLEFEARKKFENLGDNYLYVFVGARPCDKIRDLENVIIARELADNLEKYNYLVDFTSWYACIRNAIDLAEYVCLIQYDVNLSRNFLDESQIILDAHPQSIIGYQPMLMSDRNFIKKNMGLSPLKAACRTVYGIDVEKIFKSNLKLSEDKLWPATNNVAMHHEALADFVRWFEPIARHMGNQKPAGHAFERAIKLYSILVGRKNMYAPNVLSHFQLNSHETQDFVKNTKSLSAMIARNITPK